jgi:hypothetical protein
MTQSLNHTQARRSDRGAETVGFVSPAFVDSVAAVMPHRDHAPFQEITCPSCFESFEVAGPTPAECPTEWDYDCEICCRPMVIAFTTDEDDEVVAEARGISE